MISAGRPRSHRPAHAGRLLRFARWGAIVALFTLLVAPIASQGVTGDQWIVVQGGSMSPTLTLGDIIVVDPRGSIDVGDVVTARRPDASLVTHRVVGVNGDGSLELRGDANTVTDPDPVAREAVVGAVVASIPSPAATVIRAATSLAGRLTIVGAIILLLLGPTILARPAVGGAARERGPGEAHAGTSSPRRQRGDVRRDGDPADMIDA